jgi:preprotein translocase subunit SecD
MSNLKYRLLIIAALCLASVWALVPRNVTVKERGADGLIRDTTYRRVPLRRGLDLQGGMHLALEVDDSKQSIAPGTSTADAIERALTPLRVRIDGIGVSEAVVQKSGTDRIVVDLPGYDDPERARAIVQQQAYLEFLITDKTQALEKSLPRFDQIVKDKGVAGPAGTKPAAGAPKGLQGLLTGGDTAKGAKPAAAAKGAALTDSAKKEIARRDSAHKADSVAAASGGAFSSLVQVGSGMPGEYFVESDKVQTMTTYLSLPELQSAMPPGKKMLWGTDSTLMGNKWYKALYMTDAKPIITGDYLKDARPNQSPSDGTIVQFEMSNEGGRRFKNETSKHLQDYMAIVLDGRVMGRPPIIQGVISTHGQITMGGKDLTAAQDLALVLRAGALPVPLKVAETTAIGPSLGADSINKAKTAGMVAILLVVVIMIGYYRFSGMLAVGGLALYVLYTMATLAGFDAVLTLPGLAGFVLSIGIAVDANVLIFERIREEMARGKTMRTAIDEGFRHAMPAIVDSNVSTILTAAVLYQWGSGPVRGFAVTLIAGVSASMITSIFVVRTFYIIWLNRSGGAKALSI